MIKIPLKLMVIFLLALSPLIRADIAGLWVTFDDKTGEAKSYVEISAIDGIYSGKITRLLLKPMDTVCKECKDELKDKPVVGMNILKDMQFDGKTYKDGTILDPENGKLYRCKMWKEDGELRVRGYLGPFFRTQTWKKAPAPAQGG